MEIKRVLHIQLDYQDVDFLKENSEHSFIICRENFKNCDSIEITVSGLEFNWNLISKKQHDDMLNDNLILMSFHKMNVRDGFTSCKHCKV